MKNKIIGFTCSSFDLLHAGHILMLKDAKDQCDYLIVGLQTDPTIDRPNIKNRPVQSLEERKIQLEAVKYIDEIINYNTESDLYELLVKINPCQNNQNLVQDQNHLFLHHHKHFLQYL